MRDERPYIPPHRRRVTAAELVPGFEEATRRQEEADRAAHGVQVARRPLGRGESEPEPVAPRDEATIREALRLHRGD